MLGWILIFALMSLLGAFFMVTGDLTSIKFATILCGVLFLASVLTRLARWRA